MSIELDGRVVRIHGTPMFLFGGDLNYARVPSRLWRDRLLKIRGAGMNCVTFYATWAFHEPTRGTWKWKGDHDLAGFVDLIHELGLYAIMRWGPFIHGEWRNGGLPQWMLDELGPVARTNHEDYLALTRVWYEQLLEIALPRQITRGGPIIIVQLENELGSAGSKGDDIPRGSSDPEANARHVRFYYEMIRQAGIDLPIIDINSFPGKDDLLEKQIDTGGHYVVNCFHSEGEIKPPTVERWKQSAERPRVSIETGAGMMARFIDWPPYRHTNGFQGPIVDPSLVEAVAYHHLAEGYNGIHYFVLADGYNPPNGEERMLPERTMNYQAPITVVGSLRESYRAIKRIGWFLRAFGENVLASHPCEEWMHATSYGKAHPGVELGGDLFEGYDREEVPTADRLRHVRAVSGLGRVTTGLNLSESNFAILLNTQVHSSRWLRDIRVETRNYKKCCEVPQEYPKRIQMALPPNRNKIMPFYVRMAEGMFLEYSTAELLDRREIDETVQVVLHADADETTETRWVFQQPGEAAHAGEGFVHWESPHSATVVAVPGPTCSVTRFDAATTLRVVLLERDLAGDVWDLAAPEGEAVVASSLRLLESTCEGSTSIVRVQTDEAEVDLHILSERVDDVSAPGLHLQRLDTGDGLYHAHGTWDLPPREIVFEKRQEGHRRIWDAAVTPELLDDLRDLVLHIEYEGDYAQAFLDDALIGDHYFGRHLGWEVSLADWLRSPARLRLSFENGRRVKVEIKPLVEAQLTVRWK